MTYDQRNLWASLIIALIGIPAYLVWLFVAAQERPLTEVEWFWPMIWMIGLSIVAVIVSTIALGIIAGIRDRDVRHRSDVRDREISRNGDRVGHAFTVLGAMSALVLCGIGADTFWIAHALFAGLALSAIVGGIASLAMYRWGTA